MLVSLRLTVPKLSSATPGATHERRDGTSKLFEAERCVHHLVRSNFRITEMQISPSQEVPWHYHNNVQDTFYVIAGRIRIFLADPAEETALGAVEFFK